MNTNIDKEAGLRSQIKQLKDRIHSLDMNKVDPSELKAAIDSLKDLEARYADIQEKRRLHKEEKEKALTQKKIESADAPEMCGCGHAKTDHDSEGGSMLCNICTNDHIFTPAKAASKPVDIPVVASDPAPAPIPEIDTKPSDMKPKEEEKPVEKKSDVDVDAAANEDVVTAFLEMSNPRAKSQHLFIEQESPKKWNLVNYNTIIATREGDELALNTHKYSVTTTRIQNTLWYKATSMGLSVVDYQTHEPLQLGTKPKDVNPDMPPMPKEKVAPAKEASVGKFAIDDVVEPVYGSAGSYGRVMRYDADKDLAYVNWDSGKLKESHGFGAYKGSDLRKRAGLFRTAFMQRTAKQFELLVGKYVELDAKDANEAMAKAKQMYPDLEIDEVAKQMGDEMNRKFKLVYKKKAFLVRQGSKFMVYMTNVVPVNAPTEYEAFEQARQMFPGLDQIKLNQAPDFGDFVEVPEMAPEVPMKKKKMKAPKTQPQMAEGSLGKEAVLVFDVFLNGKEIDTLFYNESANPKENATEDDVRRGLIDHDGYDPRIKVVQRNQDALFPPKPMMNPPRRRDEDNEHFPLHGTEASLEKKARVVHREDGWHVLSEEGKNLGGPYGSKEKAVKRLRQVEYFKHHKGSLNTKADAPIDPKYLQMANEEIAMDSELAHDVALEHGQMFRNVQDMKWFQEAVARELQNLDEHYKQAEGTETLNVTENTLPQMSDPGEEQGVGYGGDRPGVAVAPKRDDDVSLNAAGEPGTGEVLELNIANRKWTAKRTSGAGSPDAWVIFDDKGRQVMAITMSERELSQPELEQIVFNELGKKQLVRATLSCNFAILKKGHKVKIVDIDVRRKEAKFISEENSVSGWASLDKFDFYLTAEERKPHMDVKCERCGKKVPLSYSEHPLCRECERKEEHKKTTEAELMPLSKTASSVHLKSAKVLEELIDKCPDCFKKFLKFAAEKGIRIEADDLSEHVERIRTKIEQTKEVLQTQTQADANVPAVDATGATSPKTFAVGDRVVHPNKGEGTVTYVSPDQITVDWDWVGQKILGPEPIPAAKIVNIKKIDTKPIESAVETKSMRPMPTDEPGEGFTWVYDQTKDQWFQKTKPGTMY